MKKIYFFTKTIWQILLYLIEVIGVSILLAYVTTLIKESDCLYDFIERSIMCYTLYQILVVVILTNINDIEKDSCLAYISNLKKCLLYIETKEEYIKEDILANIEYQLDTETINNQKFINSYMIIKNNIDNLKSSNINIELINAEKNYELNSLNWRFSFLLRLVK